MRNRTRLAADRRGATAAVFAIAMPVLVGMGALAVDVGIWNVQKRQAQGAADQAAFSAAVAAKAGNSNLNVEMNARAITAGMGFVHDENGVAVTVTNPPAEGQFAGNSGYWEVTVEEPQATWLAGYLFGGEATVRARAVAGRASGGNACIIGLGTASGNSVHIDQNGVFGTNGQSCGVYSNSGIYMGNNSIIAGSALVAGLLDPSSKPNHAIGNLQENSTPIEDPYADRPAPAPTGPCLSKTMLGDNVTPYKAGHYCNGMDIRKGVITLESGTYYIEGSVSMVTSGVTITSSGPVTLVLMSGAKFNDIQSVKFDFDAPKESDRGSSFPYPGIAIIGLDTYPSSQDFKNGIIFDILGAIYFPYQTLNLKNNGATFANDKCTQLVAKIVQIKNNMDMKDNCPGTGIRSPGGSSIALME